MKDFYDLHVLAREFAFDGSTLTRAIKATFKRRKTDIPKGIPMALTEEFANDHMKVVQWKAFVRKNGLEHEIPEFQNVISHLRDFLMPALKSASGLARTPQEWSIDGFWLYEDAKVEDS